MKNTYRDVYTYVTFEWMLEQINLEYRVMKDNDDVVIKIYSTSDRNVAHHIAIESFVLSDTKHITDMAIEILNVINSKYNDYHDLAEAGELHPWVTQVFSNPKYYLNTTELHNRIYEVCPLSKEEVIEYMLNQGTCISYDKNGKRYIKDEYVNDWLNATRIHQVAYAIRENIDLIDFDEWMSLENLLFGKDSEELPYGTAVIMNSILWGHIDVSPMDLEE